MIENALLKISKLTETGLDRQKKIISIIEELPGRAQVLNTRQIGKEIYDEILTEGFKKQLIQINIDGSLKTIGIE